MSWQLHNPFGLDSSVNFGHLAEVSLAVALYHFSLHFYPPFLPLLIYPCAAPKSAANVSVRDAATSQASTDCAVIELHINNPLTRVYTH